MRLRSDGNATSDWLGLLGLLRVEAVVSTEDATVCFGQRCVPYATYKGNYTVVKN